ncbi:unnamed protein product [Linum tenue]|uniref:Protein DETOXIFICATION n=1 Tax=Linum tenue TaxID=586396 RepID=A0AAV0IMB0_9ROSI|nr:unnamed protein product [Linum tenue]
MNQPEESCSSGILQNHCREEKQECNDDNNLPQITQELRKLLKLAGPLLFVSLLQFSLQITSVIFVGHLGALHLASASLTTSIAGLTGYNVMIGMAAALETLCGRAYGAKQPHMLGIHTQRAMLTFTILCIPISVLWSFTGPILRFLKQNEAISTLAGESTPWLIPSIFPFGIIQCQNRFLQTQNITLPQMVSSAVGCVVHALSCWVLIFRLDMGNRGACLANGVTYSTVAVMLTAYIKFSGRCDDTWTGFSLECARDVVSFLRLGVPSGLMTCSLEFWSYQVFIILAGLLPNAQLETSMMLISLNTSAMAFRIPMSLGSAISTRVSKELGAGNPEAARLAVRVVLFLVVFQGLLASSIATAARHVLGFLYTDDRRLVVYLASVVPILAASNFIDGIHGVLSGCARGCGWQERVAYISLGSYYLVGIPVAASFTFLGHLQGKGFLLGIIAGSTVKAGALLIMTIGTNWEHESMKTVYVQAKKAKRNVDASSLPVEMLRSASRSCSMERRRSFQGSVSA